MGPRRLKQLFVSLAGGLTVNVRCRWRSLAGSGCCGRALAVAGVGSVVVRVAGVCTIAGYAMAGPSIGAGYAGAGCAMAAGGGEQLLG